MSIEKISTAVVVLGAGPGGYSAAFRMADLFSELALDKQVTLIERYNTLGGVCLNVGCIPSKALLHTAKVIEDALEMSEIGLGFAKPKLEIKKISTWKDSIVKKLTTGLGMMAKQRKVQVVNGVGKFINANEILVTNNGQQQIIQFEHAIIAAGSLPVKLPFMPNDPRIIDSTGALSLEKTNGEMLVIGGGIIGLEMATVYDALGANITIVEMMDQLIPGCDADVVQPLHKRISKKYKNIMLKTEVKKVEAKKDGLWVTFAGESISGENPQRFDQILVAVGRRPNGKLIGAEEAGVYVDERGFIPVDKQMRTNISHIFAIGDIVGNPMLAHKASAEGRLAAEVISGKKYYFDAKCIPSVAYTDPEVAWVGKTEREAQAEGIDYNKGIFPWMASGRALGINRSEGLTKVIFDKNEKVIGAGIVGVNAGELISEIALAIEMGCDAKDIALTIHPHPTLSESIMMATEMFEGTITDLYVPKKKKGDHS